MIEDAAVLSYDGFDPDEEGLREALTSTDGPPLVGAPWILTLWVESVLASIQPRWTPSAGVQRGKQLVSLFTNVAIGAWMALLTPSVGECDHSRHIGLGLLDVGSMADSLDWLRSGHARELPAGVPARRADHRRLAPSTCQ